MNAEILNRNLQLPEDRWHQIEVSGEQPTTDGRVQVIDAEARTAIVAAFAQEREAAGEQWSGILIDRDHLSHDPAQSTEAMGWLLDLRDHDGQLEGRIEWTDAGEPAVRNKRWRFFSTEYSPGDLEHMGAGRVRPRRLSGLALTNRPQRRGGKPISNRQQAGDDEPNPQEPNMKNIAIKLGLSEEATEEDILAALDTALADLETLRGQQTEAEVEEILNRNAKRITQDMRPKWKAQLLANREACLPLLESLPEIPAAKPAAPAPVHNRVKSPAPVSDDEATHSRADAAAIHNRAKEIQTREKIPFSLAWSRAQAEAAPAN